VRAAGNRARRPRPRPSANAQDGIGAIAAEEAGAPRDGVVAVAAFALVNVNVDVEIRRIDAVAVVRRAVLVVLILVIVVYEVALAVPGSRGHVWGFWRRGNGSEISQHEEVLRRLEIGARGRAQDSEGPQGGAASGIPPKCTLVWPFCVIGERL
jgi:hypothetical protein